MKRKSLQRAATALAVVQLFNGLSALAGGIGLMSDPSGGNVAMKLEWLTGTPFSTFLIPGIILFVVNGMGNIGGFFFTLKKRIYAGGIGFIFGVIMMGWIIVQVSMIGYMSFLQPLYFATGLLQMIFGFQFRAQWRRQVA